MVCRTTFYFHGGEGRRMGTIIGVFRSSSPQGGGTWYEVIAIVTDVDQSVQEGVDGVEHM